MKLPRKLWVIFLSAVTVIAIVSISAVYFFMLKKPVGPGAQEIIKSFSFSSTDSLGEWDEKVLMGKSTNYEVAEYEGKKCVKAVSDSSASALFYKQKLLPTRASFVSWDWKIGSFPLYKHKENLAKKSEFDFAAQVYVIFHANFFLNAKAIQYVWTKELPVGTVADSPYTKNVKILVLESGESNEWKHENRDIKEDFQNLFGEKLELDVDAISFMTDADSTGTSAAAYYTNIEIGYLPEKEKSL